MRSFLGILMISCTIGAGCCDDKHNSDELNGEYMVFGHFYGECGGEGCVEIYRIEDGRLYEDTLDIYPGAEAAYQGSWVELADTKYELVKDLIDDFPKELLQEEDRVIGMPDAGDWGGIYVQVRVSGQTPPDRFWLLDQHEGHMPQVYNDFVDRINEKIAFINN
jgi:hypothetical protein